LKHFSRIFAPSHKEERQRCALNVEKITQNNNYKQKLTQQTPPEVKNILETK
jgi:hypothetical protein